MHTAEMEHERSKKAAIELNWLKEAGSEEWIAVTAVMDKICVEDNLPPMDVVVQAKNAGDESVGEFKAFIQFFRSRGSLHWITGRVYDDFSMRVTHWRPFLKEP